MFTNFKYYKELLEFLQINRAVAVKKSLDKNLFDDRSCFKEIKDKKNLIGLDIGVQYGVNSYKELKELDIKFLYLVDPYWKVDVTDYTKIKMFSLELLSEFNDKIQFIFKDSKEAIEYVPDNLDYIYIDGDHTYDGVKSDIELYYPKVKSGGLFGGHDYTLKSMGLVQAVKEFGEKYNYKISQENWDWWVIKR